MFVLKCKECGFEQIIKRRIDKETYYELTHNDGLYCDRKCCNGRDSKRPNGYIPVYGVLGGWTIVRQATLEEYKGVKRAKALKDLI